MDLETEAETTVDHSLSSPNLNETTLDEDNNKVDSSKVENSVDAVLENGTGKDETTNPTPQKSGNLIVHQASSTHRANKERSQTQIGFKIPNISSSKVGLFDEGSNTLKSKSSYLIDTRSGSVQSFSSSVLDKLVAEEEELERFPNVDDHAYEKLREVYNQIQEFFSHAEHDGVLLDPIREEFSALWDGIEASHDNEIRLIQTDRKISVDLSATMGKTRFLIKLAEDDPELAMKLGLKLERAWNIVDIGDEQERGNQAKIDQLRQDIFDLNRNINAAARVEGQETLKELQSIKNDLEKERDSANSEVNKFRSMLNVLFAKRQEVFERRTGLEEKNDLLMQEINAQNEATIRETARIERLIADMELVRRNISTKNAEIHELDRSLGSAAVKLVEMEKAVHDQRMVNEAALRDAEFSSNRIEKLKIDFDHQQRLVERMTMDAYRRSHELRLKDEEINNLKTELHRATRQRTLNSKKVTTLQQALATLEIERESLKTKIAILERDLETAQKKLEENKKKVEELDKERSFVNRNLKRASAVTGEHANQAQTHEVAVRNLEQAVKTYTVEISEQRHTILRLEKERDFYSHEATKLAQQVAFKLNDIKKLDMAIFQFRKKLGVLETQVKKTQQIYDVAVYDKLVFERTLRDTLTEILENVAKIRRLHNQIGSLKYQVNEKDEIIHREALRYDRILKETEFFSFGTKSMLRMAEDIQRQVGALEKERSVVGCSIAEIEGELSKENYYATAAESRIAVYQRKLMDKESALRQVWAKWRALHSTIRIGAYHYRNIMKDIREFRFHILDSRKKQAASLSSIGNCVRLRHEAAVLEDCIAKEKCMIGALEQQKKHPVNIHRWRLLEATDPEAYELVQKIHLLTKRLVDRNCILSEQTRQLDEKQEMYVEVRRCVDRSPSLETPEEINYYQGLLVSKKKQLETLKYELIAAESQTSYYRDSVQQLNSKMLNLKNRYFQTLEAESIFGTKKIGDRRPKTAIPQL